MGYTDEPDEKDWEHNGMSCALRRGPGGHWCGYVRVKTDHLYHEVDYSDIENLDVHGGLTYSGHRLHDEQDDGWFFGFDCNHCWDLAPYSPSLFSDETARYRDIDYVTKETEKLAEQLAVIKKEEVLESDSADKLYKLVAWRDNYFYKHPIEVCKACFERIGGSAEYDS